MRLGSSSTNSRNSTYTRRYRTRAPTSEVDESLFASPNPIDVRRGNSSKSTKSPPQKHQEGATVQIVTKDLIRNIRIPFKDPSGESVILPSADFKRITSESLVLTKEERAALKEAHQKKKDEDIRNVEDRKRQIFEADLSRQENQALTELELEARDRAQHLVKRANNLRMEQEDEIRKLNKLILGAQCQATRDVQMEEKKQIQSELTEEEQRLDAMMEVDRRRALDTVDQIDKLRKQQRIEGMQKITEQIQRQHEEKQLQDEVKELEKQQVREMQEKIILEDLEALENKRKKQECLQEEIMRINAETMQAKERRLEEERQADMRDMEYLKNKMERASVYEAEQKHLKKEKELEIARLRARQEKAKDYKAEQDELRARRNQEFKDRDWRSKQRDLAVKKAREEEMLMAARTDQVRYKEHFLSIEAGREKAEFERVLSVQKQAIVKLKEEEVKRRQKSSRHAEAIRTQVKEQELSAVAKRRELFKESERLMEEDRQRRVRLEEIKEKKLQELKATGLSDKYCSDVERKARAGAL
ncbi:cilia- and flagella-associated protein 45 [Pseudochaenichthys georgianus]|uniref:cilia- and flagella-associated protein 45 n=1 Tax=Pseudochaenichthys georgianus TaxID=52239 RepID=UPI00146F15FA|nr:cilia- and flagella-associated protein 45 [Pseudochaenichthys georgianus]